MTIISPSLLSCDFSRLAEQMKEFNESGAEWLHYDVMDGHFAPNLTFGTDILKGIRKMTDAVLDVHLMVTDPTYYADLFVKAGAQFVTFHTEAIDVEKGLALIRLLPETGVKAGVTLCPATPVEALLPYLPEVDMVLVMSVVPGFGGQSFMAVQLEKVRYYDQYLKEHDLHYLIQIDGGINEETGKLSKEAGCDVFVAGSHVFKNPKGMKHGVESLR